MGLNYLRGVFQGWEIAVTKNVVIRFKKKCPCLHREDIDELTDECLSHWLTVRGKYDLQKIEYPKGLLARVVTNNLSNLVKGRLCKKREQYYQAVSLDQFLDDNSDSPLLEDSLPSDPSNENDLRSKIDQAIKKLNPQQKKILSALHDGQLNITAISVQLKVHRSTVHNEINRIKEVFENEGLRKYLL